jgi:uncharacterized delta-60 repeat protein
MKRLAQATGETLVRDNIIVVMFRLISNIPRKSAHVLFLACLLQLVMGAQAFAGGGDILWQNPDTRAGKQQAIASAYDSEKNVIVTGFRNLAGSTNDDYYTVKFKSDGSGVLWSAFYDKIGGSDQSNDVTVDLNNDVIVTGTVWNGINLDIHTIKYCGTTGSSSCGGRNGGDVIWEQTFNGAANGNEGGTAVSVDPDNNVYVGGYSQNSSGKEDYILLKYPSAGGPPAWQARYSGPPGYPGTNKITSIAAGASGVAVTGQSWNGSVFECATLKYDLQGNSLWPQVKRYTDGPYPCFGKTVKMDVSGNVIIAASASNGLDLDIYTAKYAAVGGSQLWSSTFDGRDSDEPKGVTIDTDGTLYITGYSSTVTGHYDFYTAKHDGTNGNTLWRTIFDSGNGNTDITAESDAIAIDPAGGAVFVTGYKITGGVTSFETLKYKIDNGEVIWQRTFNGTAGKNSRPVGLGLSSDGDVLIAGWADTNDTNLDYIVLKYDRGVLNPPTNLVAQTLSSTSIRLTWSNNSNNELGFKIERCRLFACTDFALIKTTVGTGDTTYTDILTEDDKDTYFSYRLKAYNASDDSQYTNIAQAFTASVTSIPPAWSYRFNGLADSDDFAAAIAVGPDNNPVVTGATHDFFPGYSSGNLTWDYLTIKLDRNTNIPIWSDRYDDPTSASDIATCVAVDSTNIATVSGYATLNINTVDVNSLFTLRYKAAASSPQALTADQYNGPGATDDRAVAIATAVDASNNVAVVGYGKNLAGTDDIYLLKYSANGTRLWDTTPFDGGGEDIPAAVAFAPDGSIYVTGYSEKTPVTNPKTYNFYTARHNGTNGNIIWRDVYSAAPLAGDNRALGLVLDAYGDLYVTGYATNDSNDSDLYSIKYKGANTTAHRLWERRADGDGHGEDRAINIVLDPIDGNIIVGGTSKSRAGDLDQRVIRYNTAGDTVWDRSYEKPGSDEEAYEMAIDSNGTVYLTGDTDNGATRDSLTVAYNYLHGDVTSATVYNGEANNNDETDSIAINSYDEVFAAGQTSKSDTTTDLLVYKIAPAFPTAPSPLSSATPTITTANLTWPSRPADKDGYNLQRKDGDCSDANPNPWSSVIPLAATSTGYTDINLLPGSSYCYRIQSYRNSDSKSSRWNLASVALPPATAPSNLTATTALTTQVNLNWTDNTTGETGFKIERCSLSTCNGTDFAQTGFIMPANSVSYNDVDACFGTSYQYRIKAVGTGWESSPSNIFAAPVTLTPAVPSLTATRVSEKEVRLNWTDSNTDQSGYNVERSLDGTTYTTIAASLPGGSRSYNDTAATPGTTNYYRITAYKTAFCGWSSVSLPNSAVTTILEPGNVTTNANSSTQITVAWTDRTASETGFKILRCAGSGCTPDATPIFTTNSNVTSYVDASVSENTIYNYQVVATSNTATWDSVSSARVERATPAATPPLLTSVTRVSEAQINIVWTDTNTDRTGFRLWRCSGPSCSNFTQIGGVITSPLSYNDTGLIPNTSYTYYVETFKTVTFERWAKQSNQLSATTTLLEPDNFTATANNTTQVTLGWAEHTATETGFELWRCANPPCTATLLTTVAGANVTSYADSSACYGTSYMYQVAAMNSTVPWYSTFVSLASPVSTPSPATPEYLAVTQLNESSVKIDWNDPNSDESGYKVERCTGISADCLTDDKFTVIYPLAANTITYTNTGLAPNTTYTYRVRAYKNATCSWSLASGTQTITATVPAPAGLTLEMLSSTAIKLTWTNTTQTETGFAVERCSGIGCSDFSLLTASSSIAAHGTTFTDSSVCGGISYTYRIKSRNAGLGWESGYSNPATIATRQPSLSYPNILLDPNFEDAATGWSAAPNGGSADGASIDTTLFNNGSKSLKVVGDSATVMGRSQSISVVAGQKYVLSGYVNSGLTAGSAVCNVYADSITSDPGFSITANDSRNNSWVNLNEVVAIPDGTTSISVQCFTTAGSTGNVYFDALSFSKAFTVLPSTLNEAKIKLEWPDVSTDETGYRILKCTGSACLQIGQVGSGVITYIDSGLTPPGAAYDYQVLAYKTSTCNWSFPASSITTATTSATPPAPSGLTATANNTTQITLSWTNNTSSETGIVIERCEGASCTFNGSILTTTGPGIASYVDTAVTNGTSYSYKVKAVNSTLDWATEYSTTVSRATPAAAAPVLNLPSAVSDTRIDLTWTDPNSDETNYAVLRDNVVIATMPANTTFYSDTTGITAGNSYTYMIKAVKSNKWTVDSNPQTASPSTPAPSIPTIFVASSTQLNLSWVNNTSTETEVRVERCQNANCNDFAQIAVIPKAQPDTSYQDTSVVPGTTYRYQVRAANTAIGWTSEYSPIATATATALTVPGTTTATRFSEEQINLSWSATAGVSGYNVYYCTGAGCTPTTLAGTVSTTTFQHTGLAVNTYYRYWRTAYKTGTTGCPDTTTCQSGSSAVTTNTLTTLNAPTAFTATAVNSTSVRLQWTNNTVSETGFVIERCTPAGSCSFGEIANTAAPHDTSWVDSTVEKITSYQYRIKAANAAWTTSATPGFTAFSNTATATTPDAGPPYPVTAVPATNKVTLTWGDNCSAGTQEEGFNLLRCTGSACDPETDPSKFVMPYPGANSASSVTKADTAVCSSQAYVYKVQAYNNTNHLCDFASSNLSLTTATPSNPVLTSVTQSSEVKLTLTWADATPDTASYDIYRCFGNSCSDFVKIGSKTGAPLTYDDTSVLPGTTYTYQIRGNGGTVSGCGQPWQTTSNNVVQIANINVPSSLTATPFNMNRIDLAWTDTDATTTGWKIERCTGSGCSDFTEIAVLGTKTPVSYSDNSALAGTAYEYRIRATGSKIVSGNTYYWVSGYSSVAAATTPQPVAPSALTASMVSSSQINLSWTPSSTTDLSGYAIERCTGTGCLDFIQITTVTPYTATAYSNTDIASSTTYRYRIRGYKTSGGVYSSYSNIAEAVTLMGAPGSLTATAIGSHAVKLAWNEVFPGQDSVSILVQIWNGEWVQLANVDGVTSEYTDISGVSPLATYTYQVRAFRGNSYADSNLASVTMPGYTPADASLCVAGPLPNQPQITSTPITVASEGVLYSYNVIATAVGTGNSITSYALAVKPNGMNINPATGAITWTPDFSQSGNMNVTVRVTDSLGVTAIQSFVIVVTNDTQLPRITSTAVTTCYGVACTVGQSYSYQVTAFDPEGNGLTYSLTAAPAGMSISASGLISWSAATGANNVIATVTNATKSVNQSFSIPVSAYHPLVITSSPNTSAVNGAPYSYQLTVTNSDNYPLSYSLTTAPAGMTISQSGNITWVPTTSQSGDNPVTVQVSDRSLAAPASQPFTITVSQYNVPNITAIPAQTASEGVLFSYQVVAAAPLGGTLTYSLSGAPAGMSISSSGLITWTPATGQGANGMPVTVRVQAGIISANSSTQTFNISAPFISSSPGTTPRASVGVAYSYTVTSNAIGCTGICTPVSYSLINTGATPPPTGMTINTSTGLVGWTPSAVQTGYIPVTVKAAFGTSGILATQAFNIAVPYVSSTPAATAAVGSAYSTTITAVDPAGGAFTYSLINTPPTGMSINSNSGAINWTPSAGQGGSSVPVTVKAAVNGTTPAIYATQSFNLSVAAITSTPATSALEGYTYSYQVNATGTSLTYSLDTAPTGMTISSSGLVSWPTPTTGTVPVTVRVTTGGISYVTQSYNLIVSIPPPLPAAPVLVPQTGLSGYCSVQHTFSWNAVTPQDADPVWYNVQIDTVNTFNSPYLQQSSWQAGTSWQKPLGSSGQLWYWRVQARDNGHQPLITPSETASFTEGPISWDCGCDNSCTSSCPLVYSWNGTGYGYETDLQGPAISQIKKGLRNVTLYQPSYITLEDLVPDENNQYKVKIWESLIEATLLDEAKLLVLDYPEGYQIASSGAENTYYYGYADPFRIYTLKDAVLPLSATDKNGSNVLPALLEVDDNPAPMVADDPDNFYTLDFGTIQHPENAKLVIDGWQIINSTIYLSNQTIQPYIEVVDGSGAWVKVKSFGMPMGDLKTMVIDISNQFLSSDHRVRVHLGIKKAQVWVIDRISLDDSAPINITVQEITASSADLQAGGHAIKEMNTEQHRILVNDESMPPHTNYYGYGNFTRFGEVGELVTNRDDKYVVMNYADKLDLTFPALPALGPGMTRGFILKADNYYKEFKQYKYLEPLPFHGMSDYPPPTPEAYPTDEDHNQYRLLYNTRVFSP